MSDLSRMGGTAWRAATELTKPKILERAKEIGSKEGWEQGVLTSSSRTFGRY
jgi:hypothetical protein